MFLFIYCSGYWLGILVIALLCSHNRASTVQPRQGSRALRTPFQTSSSGPIFPIPKVFNERITSTELDFVALAPDFLFQISGLSVAESTAHELQKKLRSIIDLKVQSENATRLASVTVHLGPWSLNADIPWNGTDASQHATDHEAYQLSIDKSNGVSIHSLTIRGVQHAMYSLSNLLYSSTPVHLPLTIVDWPKRPWRGLMLDVARHFIPLPLLYRTVDAMAASRLNILHLHLTDSQSFPLALNDTILPDGTLLPLSQLSKEGSFDALEKVYYPDDLRRLVAYAHSKHIEVIPEIDTPAHALAWGQAFPELIVRCRRVARAQQTPHNIYPLDPSQPLTFIVIEHILSQLIGIFPSRYFHVGGDEVNEQCWRESDRVMNWTREAAVPTHQITKHFETRVFQIVRRLGKIPIVWQGIWDAGNMPDSEKVSSRSGASGRRRLEGHAVAEDCDETESSSSSSSRRSLLDDITPDTAMSNSTRAIVEPWKCWGGLAVRAATQASRAEHPVWMAACWYLDFNSDWTTFLAHDLLAEAEESMRFSSSSRSRWSVGGPSVVTNNNTTVTAPRHQDYFQGGEGALWTENVDATNFECRLWPRAGAIAQALWGFRPNDCQSLTSSAALSCEVEVAAMPSGSNNRGEGGNRVFPLTLSYAKYLYSSFALYRHYLADQLSVQAAPLIFHYPERPLHGHHNGRRSPSALPTAASGNSGGGGFMPIYPRNLSRALQLIDAMEVGITITSSGPRFLPAPAPPSSKTAATSSDADITSMRQYHHYLWITAQCMGIPEAIQRPLHAPGLSIMQFNVADGSLGARRDAMLGWLQSKAQLGVQIVGFCELVGWQDVHSRTELVKNVPWLTLRAANAGYAHSYITQHVVTAGTSTTSTYPVGLVSVYPFTVVREYHSPQLQRSAMHARFQLPSSAGVVHVFVVHLHAHSSGQRLREAEFLVQEMQSYVDAGETVVVMGDFNTLSPFDRGIHEADKLSAMLQRSDHQVFTRLRKKFMKEESPQEVDYRPMQRFLNAGFRDVCVDFCCQQVSGTVKSCQSRTWQRAMDGQSNTPVYDASSDTMLSWQRPSAQNSSTDAFSQCMLQHCPGSEPTKYNPEWPREELQGLEHPWLRLDYVLVHAGRAGGEHPIRLLAAGVERNNVTDILSDHYPVHATLVDVQRFPQGLDVFGN